MNEQIKTALLGIVAVLTVVNTVMLASGPSSSDANGSGDENGQEQASNNDKGSSNVAATRQNRDQGQDGNQGPDLQANPAQGGQQGGQQGPQGGDNKPDGPPTTIEFEKYEHDFGEMNAGSKKTKKFSFTNTGDKPYVIQNAKGSCGCTVPSYPEEPIEPGESGEIEVNYKPGDKVSGQQTNNVTLTGNTEPPQTKLKIRANVQSAGS